MQQQNISTLNPARSRDALRKLRETAEKEADAIPSGVISTVTIKFDKETPKVTNNDGDPNDHVGAASYSGQNSPHIGNGSGGVQ